MKMWNSKLYTLTFLTVLSCLLGAHSASDSKSTDYCFCKLKGRIEDCNCTFDTVDSFNEEIYPRLQQLLIKDYFGFHKLPLHKECPFWVDDGKCSIRYCHVETCSDRSCKAQLLGEVGCPFPTDPTQLCRQKDVPPGIKQKQRNRNSMFGGDMTYKLVEGNQDCLDTESDVNEELSFINSTISAASKEEFAKWQAHDALGDFCDYEEDEDAEYVDLRLNPERYTGYKGKSAHRVWRAIYEENCFRPKYDYTDYYATPKYDDTCREKRIPYTIVSGLHASINIHLCANYLLSEKLSLMDPRGQWGPNLVEFERRFHPSHTNGEGPLWLQNLYFIYLLELRALAKAAPYLAEDEYYTGNDVEDEQVRASVKEFLNIVSSFPEHFDEKTMFIGGEEARKLKDEFRGHFRNISRIMDCVGCEKCKLWGKLQIRGLGTALKILFSGKFDTTLSRTDKPDPYHSRFHLQRSEIVTLFNAFGRLSTSIEHLKMFRRMLR